MRRGAPPVRQNIKAQKPKNKSVFKNRELTLGIDQERKKDDLRCVSSSKV